MGYYPTEQLAGNALENSSKPHTPYRGLRVSGLRYYNPELGRWVNRDPVWEKGGGNVYCFVGNRPVGGVDFIGLFQLKIIGIGPDLGLCGNFNYGRILRLAKGAEESFSSIGWVVQEIESAHAVFDCKGNLIDADYDHFWEAFEVLEGRIFELDRFGVGGASDCTQGYGYFSGSATYYDSNVVNIPPWIIDPDHPSSGAPYIPNNPALGSGDSNSFHETIHYRWNCCAEDKATVVWTE